MLESIQSNKVLLMLTKLQSVAHNYIFCRISFANSVTIAKRRSEFIKNRVNWLLGNQSEEYEWLVLVQ